MSDRDGVAWEKRRGHLRVSLKYDNEAQNPREDGDMYVGTIVVPHRSYTIGESDSGDSVVDAVRHAMNEVDSPWQERIIARYLTCWWGATTVLGVHLYEHGNITVKTSGVPSLQAGPETRGGRPDGYIFDTPEARERTGVTDVAAALVGEIEELASYYEGDVYGVVVERYNGGEDDEVEEEDDFEELDAVWGYVGEKYAREVADEQLQHYLTTTAQEATA